MIVNWNDVLSHFHASNGISGDVEFKLNVWDWKSNTLQVSMYMAIV